MGSNSVYHLFCKLFSRNGCRQKAVKVGQGRDEALSGPSSPISSVAVFIAPFSAQYGQKLPEFGAAQK
jgi:hypothetical protein